MDGIDLIASPRFPCSFRSLLLLWWRNLAPHTIHQHMRDVALAGNFSIPPRLPVRVIQHEKHGMTPICVSAPEAVGFVCSQRVQEGFALAALMDRGSQSDQSRFFGGLQAMKAIGKPVGSIVII